MRETRKREEVGLPKKDLIPRICYLYFIQRENMRDIGERLGISRFKVSRYIEEARIKGIVSFQINHPDIGYVELASRLERALAIKRVIIAPTVIGASRDEVRFAIGKVASQLVSEMSESTNLAITWGRTIAHMVDEVRFGQAKIRNITEMAGSVGKITTAQSGYAVALSLASKLGANCIQFPAPILVDNPKTLQNFLKEPVIARALRMAAQSDYSIAGVGPVDDADSGLHRAGFISEADLKSLKSKRAVGSLLGRFFDSDGNECDSKYKSRALALNFEQYKKIPERIVLAGGSHKVESIYVLATHGFISTLVTDSATAEALAAKAGYPKGNAKAGRR